jgi:hypothetical protein
VHFSLLAHFLFCAFVSPAASPEQARIVKNEILSLNLSTCKAVFEVGKFARVTHDVLLVSLCMRARCV